MHIFSLPVLPLCPVLEKKWLGAAILFAPPHPCQPLWPCLAHIIDLLIAVPVLKVTGVNVACGTPGLLAIVLSAVCLTKWPAGADAELSTVRHELEAVQVPSKLGHQTQAHCRCGVSDMLLQLPVCLSVAADQSC